MNATQLTIGVFNLNKYIGGGETVACQFAKFLVRTGLNTFVICHEDSYIATNIEGIEKITVQRTVSLSYNYSKDLLVFNNVKSKLSLLGPVVLVCMTMRDFYNAAHLKYLYGLKNVNLYFYSMHPGEVDYLTRYTLFKGRRQSVNRKLINKLVDLQAISFTSLTSLAYSGITFSSDRISELPFDFFEFNPSPKLKSSSTKHLMISRFVRGKIASCLTFILLAKNTPKDQFSIIGYGPYENLLRIFAVTNGARNVSFVGKCTGEELNEQIAACDIGYGQGTSMLHFINQRIPVICMTYGSLFEFLKSPYRCGGCFQNLRRYDYGDVMIGSLYPFKDIRTEMRVLKIKKIPAEEFERWIKSHSTDLVFSNLLNRLTTAKNVNVSPHEMNKADFFRRMLHRLKMLLRL